MRVIDLGRMPYRPALELQRAHHAALLADRGARVEPDRILLVEHDPVVTVSRRPAAAAHVLLAPEALARLGIDLVETDRGGDVTYHGPGQLVAYPIVDLNRRSLRLHEYMRSLEDAVIATLARFGIAGEREAGATGVWTHDPYSGASAKVCAMGVRVQRWITLHGLALNVRTNLEHFGVIVPCGLAGRAVTSMERLLGTTDCPSMSEVQRVLCEEIERALLPDQG